MRRPHPFARHAKGCGFLCTAAGLALALCAPALARAQARGNNGAPATDVPVQGGRGECRSVPSRILGHPVNYCVLLPPSYDVAKTRRYPVLYWFHGIGENERVLLLAGGFDLINDLWSSHKIEEFLIVTPGADSTFDINSYGGRTRYGDFLLQEFLPYIESHYRVRAERAARGVAGISMGGYGALHLAFTHPALFGSVAVHSAALIERLPALTIQDSDSPGVGRLRILGDVFGSPPNAAFWDRNNPLEMAKTMPAASLAHMAIYFDCGTEDDYGFNAGAASLDKTLTARDIPHEFHLYPGGHDWGYFAAHMPASLEFESKALTAAAPAR